MKRIFSIFISGIVLVSCNGFLNLYPEGWYTDGNYYKTPEQMETALTGCYTSLNDVLDNLYWLDEMRSDNSWFIYNAGNRASADQEALVNFLETDVNMNIAGLYSHCFKGISSCNTVLSRLDGVVFKDNKQKLRIRGEALFLRSYYYFLLVQYFDAVPLYTKEVTKEEECFAPRTKSSSIYRQIETDLREAMGYLDPVNAFPQSGHATQGAVKMLLAYTYMTREDRQYELAETELRDILDMGYDLVGNYGDVFTDEYGKESIFEIGYIDGDYGLGNNLPWIFSPVIAYGHEEYFGISGSNSTGGFNTPTKDLIESFDRDYGSVEYDSHKDMRYTATLMVVDGYCTHDGANFEYIAPVKSPLDYVMNLPDSPDGKEKISYYICKKFFNPPYTISGVSGQNYPLFRFSDALLLLSESLVRQGKSGAAEYINRVRKRAGLSEINDDDVTLDVIAQERRLELAFENHRWADLKRLGMADSVMKTFGSKIQAEAQAQKDNGEVLTTVTVDGGFTVINEYYPLPSWDKQINPNLNNPPID